MFTNWENADELCQTCLSKERRIGTRLTHSPHIQKALLLIERIQDIGKAEKSIPASLSNHGAGSLEKAARLKAQASQRPRDIPPT
jgi:hypothetical protein